MSKTNPKKWYRTWWGVLVIILFLPVFAIWYIWKKTNWPKNVKIAATVGVTVFCIISLALAGSSNNQNTGGNLKTTSPAASTTPQKGSAAAIQNNQAALARYIPPVASKTSSCHESNGLPDAGCTPGATDSRVTQSDIKSTICVSGYTTTVRPSTSYTDPLKVKQIQEYGFSDTKTADYEEDHFIPLEVGGSPTDPSNLWPEPYNETYGSHQKDKVENYLHDQVCSGAITLTDAQKEVATNWESVYIAHYGAITPAVAPVSVPVVVPVPVTTPAPTSSTSTVPAGVTGKCNDGTYTSAVNHQGACSHHGGVAFWY